MKLLYIVDWYIGWMFNGYFLLDEQEVVFK